MPDKPFTLPPLSMIMLGVHELDRALAFYQEKLGLKLRQRIPGFAFLESGAVSLVLSEPLGKTATPTAGATEIVFSVNDVRACCETLEGRGVEFFEQPHNVAGPMWAANFRDPDGHLLSLFGPERGAS
ncbi:MAG: VOC family protein [Acidobacteriales bacterium]|nr:VOC family protein [Terriglobales bacterium]